MVKTQRSHEDSVRRRFIVLEHLADYLKRVKKPGSIQQAEWEALIWAIAQLKASFHQQQTNSQLRREGGNDE